MSILSASSGIVIRHVVKRTSGILPSSILSTCPSCVASSSLMILGRRWTSLLGVLGHGVQCTAVLEPLDLTLVECM